MATNHLRVPDHGAARETVAIARAVACLCRHLHVAVGGVFARIAQAQTRDGAAKTGSQTMERMVAVGRCYSQVNTVVFVQGRERRARGNPRA